MNCNCKEKCFVKTIFRMKENIMQKVEIYKCNRLPSDGVKKQACNFIKEIIIKEIVKADKEVKENDNNKENKSDNIKRNKLKINYKDELNKLLDKYNSQCTNYFGRLNYYMQRLGYKVHDPPNESFDELMNRLSKTPIKQKSIIYINKDAIFSQTIGEYNFDLENEKIMHKNIVDKENMFKFTNDPYIKQLLTIEIVNNKKSKNKSKNKFKNNKLNVSLDELEQNDVLNEKNKKEKDNENIENDDDDDDDDDDDNSDSDYENNKDNEFDVDNYSDEDDYEDIEYEDFSD